MVVGSAEQSGGGVASVIRLMREMPLWDKYNCYWLGTQIQADKWTKLRYALWAYVKVLFVIWRYDIIHFHTVPDQSMTVQLPVLLLALLGRKKVLFHIHCGNQLGMDMCTNNRIAHWCMSKADDIVLLGHSFEGLLDTYWPEAKGERHVIYNAMAHHSVSEERKVNSEKLIVNNEIKTFGACDKLPCILFAGTFNYNKSAEVLVKAFAAVHNEFSEWRLQLLGSGPNESAIRQMVRELGIEDCVDMPGYVYGAETERYFQQASIYVMCSRYEGFPMVVLEAWANNVCVITTPVGALPDFIEEGKNCLTLPIGNQDTLAKQLTCLMGDDKLRNNMAEYGKAFVSENFSTEKINDDWDKLYQSLIK